MDVCPRCLRDEFASADVIKDADLAEFAQEARINTRRQMSRVEKMNIGYASNSVFSFAGKLNFAFGVLLFLFCVGLFQVGDTAITRLPISDQTIFSLALCAVAAGLLMFSFRRHKALVSVVAVTMLAVGYFLPRFSVSPEQSVPSLEAPLTDEELKWVTDISGDASSHTYAIYLDEASSSARDTLKNAFCSIFSGSEARTADCRQGVLFAVLNVKNTDEKLVKDTLSHLGEIIPTGCKGGPEDRVQVFMVRSNQKKMNSYLDKLTGRNAKPEPVLTREELQRISELRTPRGNRTYAIYINDPNTRLRDILCDTFQRQFRSGNVVPWSCREGFLFAVPNVQNRDPRTLTLVLETLGDIVEPSGKADVDERIQVYMVHCDKSKTKRVLGETYSPELLDRKAGGFVEENIKELEHLDAARVEQAAKRLLVDLEQSNGEYCFCRDICAALHKTLSQNWANDMKTYRLLVEALVSFAKGLAPDDKEMQELVDTDALVFFKISCVQELREFRNVPKPVLDYLVARKADEMVDPIFAEWSKDDADDIWQDEFDALQGRFEPKMLELLKNTDPENAENIARIRRILIYLDKYGSAAAVPYVKPLLQHSESSIRWTAMRILDRFGEK